MSDIDAHDDKPTRRDWLIARGLLLTSATAALAFISALYQIMGI
jgi:hypothetical protein